MVQIQPTRDRLLKFKNSTNGSWWMFQIQPTENTHSKTKNPTNGSWWMFQIQPTENTHSETENPTNGSWWMVQIQPTRDRLLKFKNPTNGSWWMVQIQPAFGADRFLESHQRELVDVSDPASKEIDLRSLRIPPTAVGGWFRSSLRSVLTDFLNPTNGSWW